MAEPSCENVLPEALPDTTPTWLQALQACMWGDDQVVESYLRQPNADVNKQNDDGTTVLHQALERGNLAVAEILLRKGADPSIPDKHGRTALHYAVKGDHLTVVEMLLGSGMDLSLVDEYGRTALHYAVMRGLLPVLETLLVGGADQTTADRNGMTPLQFLDDPFAMAQAVSEESRAAICALFEEHHPRNHVKSAAKR